MKVGATGLGILRGAPGTGAVIMAIVLAHWPLKRRAGAIMLWCVAGFGTFTLVFGLSRNVVLSVAALVLIGACDMVSVIVRHTLVQMSTPDEMRGRVSAVNMIFIGASNEVGQFESGLTAAWFGAVPAVVARRRGNDSDRGAVGRPISRIAPGKRVATTAGRVTSNSHIRLIQEKEVSMRNNGKSIALILWLGLASSGNVFGQASAINGEITGTVTDASGAAVVGANVQITNVDTGFKQAGKTSESGLVPVHRAAAWDL